MNYKLKTEPEIVYWREDKQCTIEDEHGIQYEIQIVESTNGTEYYMMQGEDGNWEEILDDELYSWVSEKLPFAEIE